MPSLFLLGLYACLVLSMLSSEAQISYTPVDVPGSRTTEAWGINSAGDVVGSYSRPVPYVGSHAFLLRHGRYTYIPDFPGSTSTVATGINDSGQIVGYYTIGGRECCDHGFLYENGAFQTIDIQKHGILDTSLYKINNLGAIVGSAFDFESHGFVKTGDKFTEISVPGAEDGTGALGINDAGDVVGEEPAGIDIYAFIYTGGTYTTFLYPGTNQTSAFAVNNSREVVGWYGVLGTGNVAGFAMQDGKFVSFTYPQARYTFPLGINSAGQVVGEYVKADEEYSVPHGFITSPITPSSAGQKPPP
jgi:probable HAF family extracellular repeat protein